MPSSPCWRFPRSPDPNNPPSYHVAGRIPLAGEGGWDYLTVDSVAHRLYVSRGTHVAVIDVDRDSVVGDIPNTNGVHGIAFVRELNRGFTSNGRDTTVTIFDLKTLAPIAVVKVSGRNPDAITYDPVSRRVFTFNGDGANATAIDPQSGAVVGSIDLGGKPENAVSDGRGHMYVNIEDKSELVAFDPKTLLQWSHGGRGEGTMTLVHEESPDSFRVVATVPTQRGGRTIALDERTHRLYTVAAQYGQAPAPTPDRPRPRPPVIPGSVVVAILER